VIDGVTDPNERVRSIVFALGLSGFLEMSASSQYVSLASLSASGISICTWNQTVLPRSLHLQSYLMFFTTKVPEHEEATLDFEPGSFELATIARILDIGTS